MKPIFFLFFFLFLATSCNNQSSQKQINEFKDILGEENVLELDQYIAAFENDILKVKYPSIELEDAYRKIAFKTNKDLQKDFNNLLNKNSGNRFLNSQLWYEIYAPADSVWIENKELRIRFVYKSSNGMIPISETGQRLTKKSDVDSLKPELLKWKDFNKAGKYLNAIFSVKTGNKFLRKFAETKNNFGMITPGVLQDLIKLYDPDLNDYLNRRIIAIELSKHLINHRKE